MSHHRKSPPGRQQVGEYGRLFPEPATDRLRGEDQEVEQPVAPRLDNESTGYDPGFLHNHRQERS